MKTLIFIALLLSGMNASAQTTPFSSPHDGKSKISGTERVDHPFGHNHRPAAEMSFGAETLDSFKLWIWNKTELKWDNNSKTIDLIYDGSDRITNYTTQNWDGTKWVNRLQYEQTYDANGNLITQLGKEWDGSAWRNAFLFTHTYDSQNNLLTQTGEFWNGTIWEKSILYTYTYDAAGNQLSGLIQEWTGSNWENDSRYLNTYDINNNHLSYLVQGWENSSWVNAAQYLYVYDSENNLLSLTYQNWDGSNWLDFVRYIFTYDANGNQITELGQYSVGGVWVDDTYFTSTYDADNLRTTQLVQTWTGSEWIDADFYTYGYDANHNSTYELRQVWNGIAWVNSEERSTTFNTGNIILSEVNKYYQEDGLEIEFGDSIYYYFNGFTSLQPVNSDDIQLLVYPNPGNGQLSISSEVEITSVRIYNLQGQQVYFGNNFFEKKVNQIDLPQVGKGMYYANFVCAGKSYSRVIIIQ